MNNQFEIKLNNILDKISKYGRESLTHRELSFLESFSSGEVDKNYQLDEDIFEDFDGYFRFELTDVVYHPNYKSIQGTLYVPDLKLKSISINGILHGYIMILNDGRVNLKFKNGKWDIWDFCNGLECELDIFIDSVINEINEKRGFKI